MLNLIAKDFKLLFASGKSKREQILSIIFSIVLGMIFITVKLSDNGKKAALVISAICSLILIYFMLRYGIEMVQNQIRFHSKTTALRWPTYIQGLALPTGAVFMGIRTIQAAYQQLKEGRQK